MKYPKWILAVAALGIAGMAAADVRQGVEAWRNGDYASAIAQWQPLARTGDADAQFNLGQAYKLGRGVPQDMARAEQLFEQAARQGHLQAEANYGLMLFQRGQREAAMPWIIRAANRGEPRAQYIYGTALFNGDYAPRDWERAYAMMTQAADQGIPQAAASLEQLDEQVPPAQREAGIALARQLEARTQRVEVATATPPPTQTSGAVQPRRVPEPSESATPVPEAGFEMPPAAPRPMPPATQTPARQPAPTPMQTAATGDWRIQLGAFSQRARAERHWRNIRGRVSAIAGLQPFLVQSGRLTRLQAGPFRTEAAAGQACAAARRAGSDCITARRP